ncbi:MAG TPA: glycosyltransferase family 2 protein [Candidatus Krumholzibacteria bacterium]|nr:glycosyltransferase family 2 protein [Candidatus Krumholzibacteria bacterium]
MHDAHPQISVVLPTHNRARLLPRAIASVLAQTFGDLELIVVDDASTDETPSLVAGLRDPRVRPLRLERQAGASAARNAGIDAARAPLIAFMDSDDRWHADKLARQIARVLDAGPDVGLCVCSMEVHRAGRTHAVRYRDQELSPAAAVALLVAGTGMGTPCWLARRDLLRSAGGFNAALPRMQDYECALRLAQRAPVLLMSDVLVTAEIGADSLSASADGYARAIDMIVRDHRDLFDANRAGQSRMIFRAGKYFALEGRAREARQWFRRALRVQPGNARALAGLILSSTGLFPLLRRIRYRGGMARPAS